MNRISKLFWFLNKPEYLFILTEIIKNKIFSKNQNNLKSLRLCNEQKINYSLLKKKLAIKNSSNNKLNKLIDFKRCYNIILNNRDMLDKAQNYGSRNTKVSMKNFVLKSGASNIQLLYDIVISNKPKNIIETGVAYGWSSYAILLAIKKNRKGKLISIDLPYPLINERKNIGVLVPKTLRNKWKILFCRDKLGIINATKKFKYKIDFCHYDSDKNYRAKLSNLKLIWNHINTNGVIICDDINDNLAFFDFVNDINKEYFIIKCGKKFIGIVKNA